MKEIEVPYRISLPKYLQGSSPNFGIEILILISLPVFCGVMYMGYQHYPSTLTLVLISAYLVLPVLFLFSLFFRSIYWKAFISPHREKVFLISEKGIILEDKLGARVLNWREVSGYKEKEKLIVFTVKNRPPLVINLVPVLESQRYGDLRKLVKEKRVCLSNEFD
ncbi:MAG: hypothetical protein AB3N64_04980 [Puniceicoccaceae bacterium]